MRRISFFQPSNSSRVINQVRFIWNIRRSGAQSENVKISVSASTSISQIDQLKERLAKFAKDNSRDFSQKVNVTISEIAAENMMVLSIQVGYRNNWQDSGRKSVARNLFMQFLKENLRDLDISLGEAINRIS